MEDLEKELKVVPKVIKGYAGILVIQKIDFSLYPMNPPLATDQYYYYDDAQVIFEDQNGALWFGIYEDHKNKMYFCNDLTGSKKLFLVDELKVIFTK